MSNKLAEKTILILGASRGQVGLYMAAKEMGYKTVSLGIKGSYPGISLADEVCFDDIEDNEAVLKAAQKYNVDAIVTSCHDYGLTSLAYASEKLGLTSLSAESSKASVDKVIQKNSLTSKGVPVAKAFSSSNKEEIAHFVLESKGKVVVKQQRSQGSSGVMISDDSEISKQKLIAQLEDGSIYLAEEYLEGIEFGAQAFIQNGQIKFILPHYDLMTPTTPPMPIGHGLPLECNQKTMEDIHSVCTQAIAALGLDNCAVNIDLMLCDDGVRVIELAGRAGANGLPELVSTWFGRNYYKDIIQAALGVPVAQFASDFNEELLVKLVASENGGTMPGIATRNLFPNTLLCAPFLEKGSSFDSFTSLRDCIGEILVKGSNKKECLEAFEKQVSYTFGLSSNEVI